MPISASLAGAFRLHLAGDVGEAEKICIGALHSDHGNPDALHLMGHIAASRGQYDVATALIARAIGAGPRRGDLHAGMGNVFAARNLHEGVRDSYRRALLRTYFTAMPASLDEIFSHAGYDGAAEIFSANVGLYKSHAYQDVVLDRWVFEGLRDAIFVDIGGADGAMFSNTCFFEKARGWRGFRIAPTVEAVCDLNAIARAQSIREIAYLNIGAEGSGIAILQSIPFETLPVHALSAPCDNEHALEPMRVLMDERGFALARRLGEGLLFLNRASPFHAVFAKSRGSNVWGPSTFA